MPTIIRPEEQTRMPAGPKLRSMIREKTTITIPARMNFKPLHIVPTPLQDGIKKEIPLLKNNVGEGVPNDPLALI
jgi:hypothetical protein